MANQNINMVFGIQGHDVVARGMNQIERQVKKTVSETDKLTGSLLDQVNKLGMSEREYIKYTASLNGATKSQKDNMLAVYDAIQAKKQEAAELDKANAERDKEQAEYAQSQQAIQRIVTQLKEEHKLLGLTKDEVQLKKAAMAGATQAQLQEIAALQKSNRAKEEAIKKSGGLNQHLRFMRGGFGQVGHQIQDVSVQLQMGTDAMLVFGQQGSQIASLFGGGGAMIGAIISVGAAISTYISASSVQAEKDLKEMKEEMIESAKKAGILSDAMRQLLILETEKELEALKNAQEKATSSQNALIASNKRAEGANNSLNNSIASGTFGLFGGIGAINSFSIATKDATVATTEYNGVTETNSNKIKEAEERLDRLNQGKSLGKTKTEEAIAAFREEIAVLQLQVGANYSAAEAQMIYNITQDKELKGKPELIAQKIREVRALFAQRDALQGYIDAQESSNSTTRDSLSDQDRFIQKLTKTRNQQVLTQGQMIALEASQFDLNAEQQKTLDLIIAEMNARDAAKAKMKAEADARKELAEKERAERERQEKMAPKAAAIRKTVSDFVGLQESMKTEEELIIQSEQNKLKILEDMYKLRGEKDQQYYDMRNRIQKDADDALAKADTDRKMQMAGAMNAQLQQLASFFDESSALGKAAFVANQAMAIANAIISAEEASAKALALYPQMPAYAGMIKAMGYASAGAIAGQTLASFEGGGITFSGVRSGGLDGKGGRLAVVHSNEKITDLEKDGGTGQPVNVQFTINAVDAKGIDQLLYERRGMITGIVQKAVNNVGRRIM